MTTPINLGILLSGSGRTLQNFVELIKTGQLPARIQVVIGSKEDAYGLERARQNNLPAHLIKRNDFKSTEEFSRAVTATLKKYPIDLVTMAGFIHLYKIPAEYEGKVMNIHPALLPQFGGKGYYYHHVHEAVLESGARFSGCTVHFADNTYDHGPIIIQRVIPVLDDDTPETLAERVFKEECLAYPEAIRLFAQKRLRIEGRRVKILNH
jgi:formyltetrahydrofolate-dependent phosphoribosylglycinamide formyltransferase